VNNAKLAMAFHCYQPVDNFERESESGLKKTFQGVSVLRGDEITPGTDGTVDDMNLTIEIG